MHDFLSRDLSRRWLGEAAGVRHIADTVMTLLADRSRRAALGPVQSFVDGLAEASILPDDGAALAGVLKAMRTARVPDEALIDQYVPAAACQLGEDWVADRKSFADVTIGSLRLQRIVGEAGGRWSADEGERGGRRAVLMVVPEIEDHTLGAVVATSRLRRLGCSVCLRLKPRTAEVTDLLAARPFDAVMISFANVERLEYLGKMMKSLKAVRPDMPVLLGGAVVERMKTAPELSDADMVTDDVEAAAAFVKARSAAGGAQDGDSPQQRQTA